MKTTFPIVALLFLTFGCGKRGPETGTVDGYVTFGSEPVAEGFVIFENRGQGWMRSSPLDSEGRYQLSDVRAGNYIVSIQPPEPKRPNESTSTPAELRAQAGPVKIPDPKNIPRQFRLLETSPLKRRVAAGRNQFDIDLAEKAK